MTAIANSLIGFFKFRRTGGAIRMQEPEESQTTFAENIIAPPITMHVYQSIKPLKGKYANSPFMENFLKNIEEYNRELIEINKE